MATPPHSGKRHHHLLLFLPLLLLLVFFLFTSHLSPTFGPSTFHSRIHCNHSDGSWIRRPAAPPRYDPTCREIFKGWNCIAGGKPNGRDLNRWIWKPRDCDLPPLDPVGFLRRFRNANIGFVGDSLGRNMFVSLVCGLKKVSRDARKWRPRGADRGFTFREYNLTLAYHRTNLLVQYGRWTANPNGGPLETLGFNKGYRVDVDIPSNIWVDAPNFHDILILNTGHWWWARSKFDPVQSPMIFFEDGKPILPPISPEQGLDLALKHMIRFVEKKAKSASSRFFCTQSPRHFEDGDWDQGGKCHRTQPLSPIQVEHFFSPKHNGTNVEVGLVNEHLHKAIEGSSFQILDITHMSEFRADAHPSIAGGKKHEDCMHWCLPGVTDTWNDLLVAKLALSDSVKLLLLLQENCFLHKRRAEEYSSGTKQHFHLLERDVIDDSNFDQEKR